eukprot:627178-Amphidinium_carterae.1
MSCMILSSSVPLRVDAHPHPILPFRVVADCLLCLGKHASLCYGDPKPPCDGAATQEIIVVDDASHPTVLHQLGHCSKISPILARAAMRLDGRKPNQGGPKAPPFQDICVVSTLQKRESCCASL